MFSFESLPIKTFSFLSISTILIINIIPLTNFFIKVLTESLGVSKIIKKRKKIFVNTDHGYINLPYYKLPSPDFEMFFFKDENIVDFNQFIDEEEFLKKYEGKLSSKLIKFNGGIIGDIKNPKDWNNKKNVCGYIKSYFEENYFIFNLSVTPFDYENLFEQYEQLLPHMSS